MFGGAGPCGSQGTPFLWQLYTPSPDPPHPGGHGACQAGLFRRGHLARTEAPGDGKALSGQLRWPCVGLCSGLRPPSWDAPPNLTQTHDLMRMDKINLGILMRPCARETDGSSEDSVRKIATFAGSFRSSFAYSVSSHYEGSLRYWREWGGGSNRAGWCGGGGRGGGSPGAQPPPHRLGTPPAFLATSPTPELLRAGVQTTVPSSPSPSPRLQARVSCTPGFPGVPGGIWPGGAEPGTGPSLSSFLRLRNTSYKLLGLKQWRRLLSRSPTGWPELVRLMHPAARPPSVLWLRVVTLVSEGVVSLP